METILNAELRTRMFLTAVGAWLGLFTLRVLLWYEFWEAGEMKLMGENWFGSLDFPFPFNLVSPEFNWFMAAWSETIFSVCLLIGLATRFAALSLIVVSFVAIWAVHLPERLIDGEWVAVGIHSWNEFWAGWAITEKCADGYCTGNYKLPMIYVFTCLPLVLLGPGKLSPDHLIAQWLGRDVQSR